ncbi:MAG: hypothetical protein ACTSPI_13690 [Candidatus Heimdallarchaeaceae archaeon]
MSYINKNNDKIEHNWEWINYNRPIGYEFAEKYDPFRTPFVQEKYNPFEHDIFRITAHETHIEFSIVRARKSHRHNETYNLAYEYDPIEFEELLNHTLNAFKKKIDQNICQD